MRAPLRKQRESNARQRLMLQRICETKRDALPKNRSHWSRHLRTSIFESGSLNVMQTSYRCFRFASNEQLLRGWSWAVLIFPRALDAPKPSRVEMLGSVLSVDNPSTLPMQWGLSANQWSMRTCAHVRQS